MNLRLTIYRILAGIFAVLVFLATPIMRVLKPFLNPISVFFVYLASGFTQRNKQNMRVARRLRNLERRIAKEKRNDWMDAWLRKVLKVKQQPPQKPDVHGSE